MEYVWIVVKAKDAEHIKKLLLSQNLFLPQIKIQKIENNVKIPARNEIDKIKEIMPSELQYSIIEGDKNIPMYSRPKDLKSILESVIPEKFHDNIPRGYDIIGDIAIIEIPSELKNYEKVIGKGILQLHKRVKTVFVKSGAVQGTTRIRPLRHIIGENRTITRHRENGCLYELDISKVYFSPRLSTEHKRVAELVKDSETVIDMFAGVGPFSILIAKLTKSIVHAIDINQKAIYYLEKNITLNKLRGRIITYLGDAREIIKHQLQSVANRIIMNYPDDAYTFLPDAMLGLKNSKGIIHFYTFESDPKPIERAYKKVLVSLSPYLNSKKIELIYVKKIKDVAPKRWYLVLDIAIR